MRLLIRLVVLGLAAYGGWAIYEQYGDRLPRLRDDAVGAAREVVTGSET